MLPTTPDEPETRERSAEYGKTRWLWNVLSAGASIDKPGVTGHTTVDVRDKKGAPASKHLLLEA